MNIGMDYNEYGKITLSLDVPQVSKQTLTKLGLFIIAEAKKRCPVKTGRLRNSIGNQAGDGIYEITKTSIKIGSNVEYAGFIEEGHYSGKSNRFIEGAHYLRGAIYDNKDKIIKFLTESG